MGFWHTGYLEFHEPIGFERDMNPSPALVHCSICGKSFNFEDELRQHQFEAHPLRRPTLFLGKHEIGNLRITITRPITPEHVTTNGAERAYLNGREIKLADLGSSIAKITDDVCRITLMKDGVPAQFEIEIRIATENDLKGIEEQFKRMAMARRLDVRAVEEFIAACSPFKSAIGYCNGICNYLYGLMAKERAADCSLRHEQYIEKYSAAAEQLAPYDRHLARTIGGLIEFHFNHFQDAARLCPDSRLGLVSNRFASWINARAASDLNFATNLNAHENVIEQVATEMDAERILTWASCPFESLRAHVRDLEEMCSRVDLAEFDRVKLHMLLGELLFSTGHKPAALEHARSLRNLPAVEAWAESLIRDIRENA